MRHGAVAKAVLPYRNEEGIIQVQFVGPGGIDYINPADDPRKQ
jgi:hypothetical protein